MGHGRLDRERYQEVLPVADHATAIGDAGERYEGLIIAYWDCRSALVKSTYYRLAKRFHPDTNFGRENDRIREINRGAG
jgi:hypothetical protein